MSNKLLEVKDLNVRFKTDEGYITTVNGVSFDINQGETLAIVGESGSGKSVTSLSIMGILPKNGDVYNGEIIFDGTNLLSLNENEYRKIRGKDISMIFQEPMTALNPVFTIGFQMRESLKLHFNFSKDQAHKKTIEMLELVGLHDAYIIMKKFSHLLSGGMRQRVMIAMALSCDPKLIIADEPTPALDVT